MFSFQLSQKWISLFALALLCIAGLGHASSNSAPAKGALMIHLPGEPASLDWNLANRRIDRLVIENLQEGLVEAGAHHELMPVLAKNWEISPNGQVYTFHLRSGVVWSDGKPLVAQHFVDSWKRLLSPLTATSNGYFLLEVVGAEDFQKGKNPEFSNVAIKALDPLTIRIKLKRPMWNWIWNFAQSPSFPIRQDLVDQYGAKAWASPGNLVSLGPYLLISHETGAKYVLRKNPHYFRAQTVKIPEVDYEILSETSAVQSFMNGKVDLICYLASIAKQSLEALTFLKWSEHNTTKRLDFNVQRFPLSNPDIRRAIAMAIDRKALAQAAGQGLTAGTSAAPPSMSAHFLNTGAAYNPAKARDLIWNAHIEKLSLEILVPLFDEHADINLKAANLVQSMLTKELHAEVTLQRAETEQLYTLLRDTQQYSMIIRDWTGTNDPDEFYSFYASFSKKSTTFSDPSYDKLVEQSRVEKNPVRRMSLYHELDEILTQKSIAITPLFYSADGMLVGKNVLDLNSKSPEPCQVKNLDLR